MPGRLEQSGVKKEYKHSHLMVVPVVAQAGHQNIKLGLTQTIQSYIVM